MLSRVPVIIPALIPALVIVTPEPTVNDVSAVITPTLTKLFDSVLLRPYTPPEYAPLKRPTSKPL